MAQVDIFYTKSPLWRVVTATGAAVGGLGTSVGPFEIIVHFTMEWTDVVKESFQANIDSKAGTTTVTGTPQFSMGPLTKIEEVAVKMPADAVAGLIIGLLSHFNFFSPAQQQRLREEFAKYPKS